MQISTSEPAPVNRERGRLTDKQLAVFVFMHDFFRENDMLPPQIAIDTHFGAQGAWRTQRSLERKGYIERNAVGKYRFVRDEGRNAHGAR
jgi:hypothetical protein